MFKLSKRAKEINERAIKTVKEMQTYKVRMHYFKKPFLRLSMAERKKLLERLAVYSEIAAERVKVLRETLQEKLVEGKPLTDLEEKTLAEEFWKFDRTNVKVLGVMSGFFDSRAAKELGASSHLLYPLSMVHETLLSPASNLVLVKDLLKKMRKRKLLKKSFKAPWEV